MNLVIKSFKETFDNIIIEVGKKYKFTKHKNYNTNRKRDKLFTSNKCSNISKEINVNDFIYYICYKAGHQFSHEKVNQIMTIEQITNVTSDAYKKLSQRKPAVLFRDIYDKLYEFYEKNCCSIQTTKKYSSDVLTKKLLPIASVDASHYTLSKNLIKDNVPTNNKGKTTNLVLLGILDQQLDLPIKVISNKTNNEREAFLKALESINKRYIFVFDRLFYTEDLMRKIKEKNCHAIFRLQNKMNIVKSFMKSKKTDTIVTVNNNKKIKRGNKKGIQIRLIKYFINGNMYILGTTLLDRNIYSIEILMNAYKYRWGIEDYYKITNNNLFLKESNAKTLNAFEQELYAKMIIICIGKIVSYICTHFSSVPLVVNEHIHFDACLGTVTDKILRSLLYKPTNNETIDKLERTIQIIRMTVTTYEPDRHYLRYAVRSSKKWYYYAYIRKTINKKDNG